jgi:ASCH domain
MKALSVRQPWAWLIVHGLKPLENRNWETHYRGPLLIHAGKTLTDEDFLDCQALLNRIPDARARLEAIGGITLGELRAQCGGIVGRAELVACVRHSDSPWFVGRYGFVLENATPLPFLPLRGQLGLFEVRYP